MWTVSDKDFDQIKAWGLEENPFAALMDFDQVKVEQRWLNPEQQEAHAKYVSAREDYIKNKDFDNYYREAKKPIDRRRWEYLMKRKAWFITPLGWNKIAETGGKVVDLGCGDGDVVQRLANFVSDHWESQGITNKKLTIVGIDLNHSRVENANTLVKSPSEKITIEFVQGDAIGSPLKYDEGYFDFGLICGVLEILDDKQCTKFLNEATRIIKSGVYIEDLFERFPGGFPRDYLGKLLLERGFVVHEKAVVLSEPFSRDKLQDPKKLWPVLLDQNLWAERHG